MRRWLSPATAAGLQTDVVVDEGHPAGRILEHARLSRPDLIVMGVRGRYAIDMMLFGSTTQQVVRQASCPVLTLRS